MLNSLGGSCKLTQRCAQMAAVIVMWIARLHSLSAFKSFFISYLRYAFLLLSHDTLYLSIFFYVSHHSMAVVILDYLDIGDLTAE